MITMNDFIGAIEFKITGGSNYGWQSFGPNARWIDSDADLREYTACAVFDSITQVIYLAEVHDYVNNRAYRWVHPEYVAAYENEAFSKGINNKQAYENVNFVDLDVSADFLEKCNAIVNKKFDYDTRVMIQLELADNELLQLMTLAHTKDITLNQLVEQILTEAIENHAQLL
jgi:hypothetical protein